MKRQDISKRARLRFAHRGRALFVVAALLCSFGALSLPLTASASTANKKSSGNCTTANGIKIKDNPSVCKGIAFYKGQTITLYNIASIGGPFDDLDIVAQPFLQQYFGATVNILSITTGNTIPGQDAEMAATPNGLTLGLFNVLNDASLILEGDTAVNFNPAREAYLAATGPAPQPMVTTPGSGYTSFASMMSASSAGNLKTLTQDSGTANTLLRVWYGVQGLKTQWIPGYTSLALENTGLLRGDGPLAMISLSTSCSELQAGTEIAIMANDVPPPGTDCRKYLTGLPSFKTLAKQYGKTKAQKKLWSTVLALDAASGTPFVTQTGVAGYKIDALRNMMVWMFKQPGFITGAEADGLNPTYTSPTAAKADYVTTLKDGKSVICYVEGSC
jgi:hypothetical protein